uniref:uncharacterized protein LOC106995210 n=1 Tax=Macaca mulatta TaxID=9544 RepID=UPI0010A28700|nr:uncharacterized protein LOC106995210 [Macaca mulatta]XP_028697823.1 uncharacterized protein LOC106995210 [Macaca mulatta]
MDDGENHPLPPKAPLPAGPTQGFESQDTLACARDSLGLGLSLCLSESLSHTPDPALSLSRALARFPSLSGSLTRVLAPELVPAVQAPARRLVSSALETQRGRLGIEGLRQPGGAAHRQARPATARKLVSVGLSWRHMDATVARNWTFDWLPRAARERMGIYVRAAGCFVANPSAQLGCDRRRRAGRPFRRCAAAFLERPSRERVS